MAFLKKNNALLGLLFLAYKQPKLNNIVGSLGLAFNNLRNYLSAFIKLFRLA